MSRTPVSEALKRLDREGLVEIVPQVGCRVIGRVPQDLVELARILGALEGLAAEMACERLTATELDELEELAQELGRAARAKRAAHWAELDLRIRDVIVEASGSTHMARIVAAARATSAAVTGSAAGPSAPRGLRGLSERQQALVAALRAGDAAAARSSLERHVIAVVTPADAQHPEAASNGG
ncbi:MAG: GntR family transcriptional regulator [Conexibacter sp.]|nr:GntR family transcriptional regulator [Conexibacter sp.]